MPKLGDLDPNNELVSQAEEVEEPITQPETIFGFPELNWRGEHMDRRKLVDEILVGSSHFSGIRHSEELSPEQVEVVLSEFQRRWTNQPFHYRRMVGVDFMEIAEAIKKSPSALKSLALMEQTHGLPDVVAVENKAFVIGDCSEIVPARRDITFFQAMAMAKKMGVALMPPSTYLEMQRRGVFDLDRYHVWLETPKDLLEKGEALFGIRLGGNVAIHQRKADFHNPILGWRGVFRVPRG